MVGGAAPGIAFAVLLATLAGLPAGDAQVPPGPVFSVTLEAPTAPFEAEKGTSPVRANFTLDCQTALKSAIFGPAVIHVVATVAAPGVAVMGPSTLFVSSPSECMDGAASVSVVAEYVVRANRDAPGLQLLRGEVNATVERLGPLGSGANAKAAFAVTVDYFPYISAKVQERDVAVAPGEAAVFAIDVSNFGNAQTQVKFALAAEPPSGWQVTMPSPLTLDSPNTGGTMVNGTVTMKVVGPSTGPSTNREQAFTIVLTPAAALDANKTGDPITVSVMARARSLSSPDAAPLLAMAILGAAFASRRRA